MKIWLEGPLGHKLVWPRSGELEVIKIFVISEIRTLKSCFSLLSTEKFQAMWPAVRGLENRNSARKNTKFGQLLAQPWLGEVKFLLILLSEKKECDPVNRLPRGLKIPKVRPQTSDFAKITKNFLSYRTPHVIKIPAAAPWVLWA